MIQTLHPIAVLGSSNTVQTSVSESFSTRRPVNLSEICRWTTIFMSVDYYIICRRTTICSYKKNIFRDISKGKKGIKKTLANACAYKNKYF